MRGWVFPRSRSSKWGRSRQPEEPRVSSSSTKMAGAQGYDCGRANRNDRGLVSTMPINFRISALVPVGLIVESVAQLGDTILVTARAGIQVATCPLCGSPSRRVHSRYVREVSDLPCSGRSVRLRVVTRRFCCDTPHCRRRIFAELRSDNQDENPATIRMRMRRCWGDEGRA